MLILLARVLCKHSFLVLGSLFALSLVPSNKTKEGKASWVVTGRFLSKSLGRKNKIFKRIGGLITFGFYWGKNLFPNIKCKLGLNNSGGYLPETLTVEVYET